MINKLLSHFDFKTLFNAMGDGVVFVKEDGMVMFLNSEAEKMFSLFPSFRAGNSIYDQPWQLFAKNGTELSDDQFPAVVVLHSGEKVHNFIIKILNLNNECLWLDVNADPVSSGSIAGNGGVIMTCADITGLMQEKQRLRYNEEKYRNFLNSSQAATFLATKSGRYLDVSKGAEKIFGYTTEELLLIGRQGILIDDEAFRKALEERDRTGTVVAEITGRKKSGSLFPVLWHASIFNTSENEELVSVLMIDLSATKRVEQLARSSSFNLELILQNTDDAFLITDSELRVVTFNKGYRKTIQLLYKSDVHIGDYLVDLIPAEQKDSVLNLMTDVMSGQKKEVLRTWIDKGLEKTFYTELKPLIKDGVVIGVFVLIRDITESHLFQAKLREQNERFKLVLQATKDVVFEYDPKDDSMQYNESLYEMFGHFPGKVPTGTIANDLLIYPDDKTHILSLTEKFFKSSESIFSYPDFRMKHKDGSPIYVDVKLSIVRDNEGTPVKMYGNIRNISDRYLILEQLKKSHELFELASKASYDILWDSDIPNNRIYFSQAVETHLGISGPVTLEIKDFFSLIHPEDLDDQKRAFENYLKSDKENESLPDHRLKKSDGSYIYVKSKMLGVRNNEGVITRVIGVITNITNEKEHQLKLEKLNSELNKQTIELTRSNEDLVSFAYIASHDLQEPLRMVSSFLSLIKKKYDDILDDAGRQYIHFAVDGADRMKKLILDLLQFSRIGSNKDKKTWFSVSELIRDLLQEFVFVINEKNVDIRLEELPQIFANKSQIAQLLQNLLSNALKYSSATPLIEIGSKEAGTHWQFFIKDNGIGIDPKYFEKIFVIFQQLHTKSEYSGTGIGLAIAKKIVMQHDGNIWVDSSPGKGSQFNFTISKT